MARITTPRKCSERRGPHLCALLILAFFTSLLPPAIYAKSKPQQILGMVEIPKIFGTHGFRVTTDLKIDSSPLKLYKNPNLTSDLVQQVKAPEDLIHREFELGTNTALVYEVINKEWFKLKTKSGPYGWAHQSELAKFYSLFDVLRKKTNYFTPHWDKNIYREVAKKGLVSIRYPEPGIIGLIHTRGLSQFDSTRAQDRNDQELGVYRKADSKSLRIGKLIYNNTLPPEIHRLLGLRPPTQTTCATTDECQERIKQDSSIPIFEHQGNWAKLRFNEWSHLNQRFGWIELKGDFSKFEIFSKPEQGHSAYEKFYGLESLKKHVEVIGRQDHNGQLWLEVRVLSGECPSSDSEVLAEGWIPAHDPGGNENLWFHPGEC